MAALTLLQKGVPVTMLESGQGFPGGLLVRAMGRNVYRRRPPLPGNPSGVSSEDPDVLWYRALVPGGLSSYWTGAVPRFAPQDFYEGERLHERYRWPVSYEDIVPYYRRIERFLGVSGGIHGFASLPASDIHQPVTLPVRWRPVAARAEVFGHGLVPLPMADVSPWMVTRSGAAFNSFNRLVPMLHRFPHFRMLLGAHALRLEWDGSKRSVTGVTYVDRRTGSLQRLQVAAAVVAAGPLQSTKLLLDSTSSDFPEGLGNTEGLLGRYLHDHPKDWFVVELDKPLPRLGHAAYLTRAPYAESPPLLGAQTVIGNSGSGAWVKLLTFTPLPTRTFGITTFGTMVPIAENCVGRHAEHRDEFGLPALDLHIHYSAEVLQTLRATRSRLVAILEDCGYRVACHGPEPNPVPGESVHYAGSIRMHDSPRYGMLNAVNRLHAVHNVVVGDASAFTTGVEKNPLLTSMALSARAAERLAEDLKCSMLGS